MKDEFKKRICAVAPYQPGRPMDEVKRELGLKSVVKLASNESPYGPSPKVLAAMTKAAAQANRYPDGGCYYLRQELARRLKVKGDQLIFGNGSDEVLVLVVKTYVGEGDEVIIARPTFLIYDIASRLAGASVRQIPLKDFQYDLEAMAAAVTPHTRVIFLGNPDNPAGTYISSKRLEAFLQGLRPDIMVVIDEAYREFARVADYPDSLALLRRYPNVVVTRTFSKFYGLAGLRIGYGIARAEVIDFLNRLREPFNVNAVAQSGALACLKDEAFYLRRLEETEAQREILYAELDRLGLSYVRSVTNFILVDLKQKSSKISQGLLRQGVIVRDMAGWGMETFIRVTIGSPAENRKLVRTLKGVLS